MITGSRQREKLDTVILFEGKDVVGRVDLLLSISASIHWTGSCNRVEVADLLASIVSRSQLGGYY